MKKIAVLTCLNACQVCTGASCLDAWNRRERGFANCAGEEVCLAAFFHCNGCGRSPEDDPGMLEKLDRLQNAGVEAVHIGVCVVKGRAKEVLCPSAAKIQEMLCDRGSELSWAPIDWTGGVEASPRVSPPRNPV